MIDVCVCVGSSCHIKGSSAVVQKLKELIAARRLTEKVELRASFCMGECRDGVCIEVDGKKIRGVCAANVEEVFASEIAAKGELM